MHDPPHDPYGGKARPSVFFILYELAARGSPFLLIGVVLVFALIELSDLLDGHAARSLGQESELGKVLDPFADSVSRLTYFVAFAGSGILPAWILLILIYRDVSVAYIRVIVSTRQVLLPARLSGKVKAWIYAAAGTGESWTLDSADSGGFREPPGILALRWWYSFLAAAVAAWSLVDYSALF